MDNQYVTREELIQQLESIYGRNFASNVESMRDAAEGYFTNERLPKKFGDSVTMTLGEMLEKKLVLEFIDSNGNKCDTEASYVKVTKMQNEYQMKVQLTCTDYSDYIVYYMGCYDYCNDCEDVTPEPTVKPTVTKKYKYQYKLTTLDTYSDWSAWSASHRSSQGAGGPLPHPNTWAGSRRPPCIVRASPRGPSVPRSGW